MLVLKNLLIRNFQGSVVYCSVINVRFFSAVSSDSFNRLSYSFAFVNNFFKFSTFSFFKVGSRIPTVRLLPSGSQAPVGNFFSVLSCPLSDEDYLIISQSNCQRFSCFLFISCNSDNIMVWQLKKK